MVRTRPCLIHIRATNRFALHHRVCCVAHQHGGTKHIYTMQTRDAKPAKPASNTREPWPGQAGADEAETGYRGRIGHESPDLGKGPGQGQGAWQGPAGSGSGILLGEV
jgi:hypothetical protein